MVSTYKPLYINKNVIAHSLKMGVNFQCCLNADLDNWLMLSEGQGNFFSSHYFSFHDLLKIMGASVCF